MNGVEIKKGAEGKIIVGAHRNVPLQWVKRI